MNDCLKLVLPSSYRCQSCPVDNHVHPPRLLAISPVNQYQVQLHWLFSPAIQITWKIRYVLIQSTQHLRQILHMQRCLCCRSRCYIYRDPMKRIEWLFCRIWIAQATCQWDGFLDYITSEIVPWVSPTDPQHYQFLPRKYISIYVYYTWLPHIETTYSATLSSMIKFES